MEKTSRPTALITDGPEGIGLALAREFAQNDHDLVFVAKRRNSNGPPPGPTAWGLA